MSTFSFVATVFSLSEDPTVRVGVLEAGDWDPNNIAINVPGEHAQSVAHLRLGRRV